MGKELYRIMMRQRVPSGLSNLFKKGNFSQFYDILKTQLGCGD